MQGPFCARDIMRHIVAQSSIKGACLVILRLLVPSPAGGENLAVGYFFSDRIIQGLYL